MIFITSHHHAPSHYHTTPHLVTPPHPTPPQPTKHHLITAHHITPPQPTKHHLITSHHTTSYLLHHSRSPHLPSELVFFWLNRLSWRGDPGPFLHHPCAHFSLNLDMEVRRDIYKCITSISKIFMTTSIK